MIYPEPPDNGTTPAPHYLRVRNYGKRLGRPRIYAKHPRAAYWRSYKRKKKMLHSVRTELQA